MLQQFEASTSLNICKGALASGEVSPHMHVYGRTKRLLHRGVLECCCRRDIVNESVIPQRDVVDGYEKELTDGKNTSRSTNVLVGFWHCRIVNVAKCNTSKNILRSTTKELPTKHTKTQPSHRQSTTKIPYHFTRIIN